MEHVLDFRAAHQFRNRTANDYSPGEHIHAENNDGSDSDEEYAHAGPLDDILRQIQTRCDSLGDFLVMLFTVPPRTEDGRSRIQSAMVSKFLSGRSKINISQVLDLLYAHQDGKPKAMRMSRAPASAKKRPDGKVMARWVMRQWAISAVEAVVDEEAEVLSSKGGGLRFSPDVTWSFIQDFSFANRFEVAIEKAPTTLRLLVASAIPRKDVPDPETFLRTLLERKLVTGRGKNRRNPWVVCVFISCITLSSHNRPRLLCVHYLC